MPKQQIQDNVIMSFEHLSSSLIVVDTRSEREYSTSHISGAINLPLSNILNADDLKKTFGSVGIDTKTICVFYDNAYGAVASRVAMALESVNGGCKQRLLDVTYDKWKQNHDDEQSNIEHKLKPVDFNSSNTNNQNNILIDTNAVQSTIKKQECILLDCRERLNFLSGHIPDAINMPYVMFADHENGKILKPSTELKRLFENRGIFPTSKIQIITYCGSSGTLSGLVYYALRQAGFDAYTSMYENSFREWRVDAERPVETQPDANYWDLSAE